MKKIAISIVVLFVLGVITAYIIQRAQQEIVYQSQTTLMQTQEESQREEYPLANSEWRWIESQDADGTVFAPSDPEEFILSFDAAGQMRSSTDCNQLTGSFELQGDLLQIGEIVSTRMYCEDSIEQDYLILLSEVSSYTLEEDTLTLILVENKGSMTFVRN